MPAPLSVLKEQDGPDEPREETIDMSRVAHSLRPAGRVLLVSCYELGHQPIGLAQPLGFLESAGYQPAALDIAIEPLDDVKTQDAGFVGISVPMHTALRLGVRVADRVRRSHPACHICFFGLYASINADYLLAHHADSVIGGEYEWPLLKLVEALDAGAPTGAPNGAVPLDIDGISVRGHKAGPYLKKPDPTREGTRVWPSPSRGGLAGLQQYARLEHDGRRELVGYVEASRGCLHRCLHCPIVPVYDGRFFLVPEPVVLADIRQQVAAGARHITFGDPDFLNGPGHSLSILRAMHREFPDLTFDFTAKIEHILKRRDIFPELADLGCLFVISAVESFSDTVLRHLVKGHTREDIFRALALLEGCGMTLRPSLVAFTPWTTLDDYIEMFELVAARDLIDTIDPVQYTIRLLIPPGSALLAERDGKPAPVQAFLGPLDQSAFQYHWRHPDRRMDDLHRRVSMAVEQAEACGDAGITFERLWGLAVETSGRPRPAWTARDRTRLGRPSPRMTEPWFCCAEPTPSQLAIVKSSGLTAFKLRA
jgi:radical SAM superfamily enzyme YgiQ (UPF0313 family)